MFQQTYVQKSDSLNFSLNNNRKTGLCQCCVTALHSTVMTSSLWNTRQKTLLIPSDSFAKTDNMDLNKKKKKTLLTKLSPPGDHVCQIMCFLCFLNILRSLVGFFPFFRAKQVCQRFRPSCWNYQSPLLVQINSHSQTQNEAQICSQTLIFKVNRISPIIAHFLLK